MRFLVIYAHPAEDSFQSALHRCVVTALTDAGHEVDNCDLYAESFQPVLTRAERHDYHDGRANRAPVQKDIERLLKCQGLVFVFPTWWYGLPAILKGYFDRVWLPGVAFDIAGSRSIPRLTHIARLGVVTTYGSPWWLNSLYIGNINRRLLLRGIRRLLSPQVRTLWLAQYGVDYVSADVRERFLKKVESRLRSF